jgi:outer membrane protein assembly factor BamB
MTAMRRNGFVIAAGLLLIAVVVYLAFSSPIRSLFRSDVDNTAEANQLQSAALTVATNSNPTAGWPQWFGPFRDGRAPAGPFRANWDQKPPQKLWDVPCGRGFGSPSILDGKLYLHDRDGGDNASANERLRCLDAATGATLWEHSYSADYTKMDGGYANGPRTSPAVEDSRVYCVGATGAFFCVRAPNASGQLTQELWKHDLLAEFDATSPQWGIASSPLIEGDLVIVQPGGKNGSVAAFDKITGQLRWKVANNPSGYSSPVAATVAGQRVIFALTGNALLAISTDGKLFATYKWVTSYDGNIATPIVVGDYVFISSDYSHGCALLHAVKNGSGLKLEEVFVRNNKVMCNHHSTCVFKDGYLYGFDKERLKCVDFRKLREVDDWEADGVGKGCLILAAKHLIVLTQNGDLILVEATPEEFRLVAKLPSGLSRSQNWSLPVLVDGRLYLRDESKILCLDVK